MMNDHNGPHGTFGDRVNMHSDKELSDLLDFSAVSPSVLCQSPRMCRKNEGECSIRVGGNGRIGLLEGSKAVGGSGVWISLHKFIGQGILYIDIL